MESQDKGCGEKRNGREGKQNGRGDHRERLACVSFDGFDPTYPPQPPPKSRVLRIGAYLTATSIKAGVGSRMGLPPGGPWSDLSGPYI